DVEGVRAARADAAPPRRGPLEDDDPRPRVGLRLRGSVERRRRLRPLLARQDRSAVREELHRDRPRARLPPGRGMRGLRAVISRLSTRARLTAVSVVVAAVVFAIGAVIVYQVVALSLSDAVTDELRVRADDV